jgi:hypothetical protein
LAVAWAEGEERPAEAADGMKFREEVVAEPVVLAVPPFEEHLMQSTLWPEIYKLYGHGDNLVCLASSRSGKHIASACKVCARVSCVSCRVPCVRVPCACA